MPHPPNPTKELDFAPVSFLATQHPQIGWDIETFQCQPESEDFESKFETTCFVSATFFFRKLNRNSPKIHERTFCFSKLENWTCRALSPSKKNRHMLKLQKYFFEGWNARKIQVWFTWFTFSKQAYNTWLVWNFGI